MQNLGVFSMHNLCIKIGKPRHNLGESSVREGFPQQRYTVLTSFDIMYGNESAGDSGEHYRCFREIQDTVQEPLTYFH